LDKEIASLVKDMELSSVINQKCETLSKGYKRRVAIAGAMLSSPKLLLLDEPTEGLDPGQKNRLRKFLKKYAQNNIVLISTHIMEEVEAISDRILLFGLILPFDFNKLRCPRLRHLRRI
jgi:ABC-2 type transport system ATP-binding protein